MASAPSRRSFWCFISYRHADNREIGRQWASWLHQQIETYEIPTELVGTRNSRGDEIPERIFPVFRDEDELPADADLAAPIYRALDASKFLVVLCSPRAVQSTYVASEIAYYKRIGRSDRVLAAILDGEPNASWDLGKQAAGVPAAAECFPRPLQHPVNEAGELDESEHAEPIAADFRLSDGSQGWTSPEAYRQALEETRRLDRREIDRQVADYRRSGELAKLKIIAGILGVSLGTLTQRDKAYQLEKARRRARLFRRIAGAMAVLTVLALAAGAMAWIQQREAETQRRMAEGRRVEAEEARQLAETRRGEAESARKLAEERRVESEQRLGRSNLQLADRLAREGDTAGAAEALWAVPASERQWEWGYALGRAYPDLQRFAVTPAGKQGAPQVAQLDPAGRRVISWPGGATDAETLLPTPGVLRFSRLDEAARQQTADLAVAGRIGACDWSRDGHALLVDDDTVKILRPDGTVELTAKVEGVVDSGGFLDAGGRRIAIKTGEFPGNQWRLYAVEGDELRQTAEFTENFEGERFGAASPDGTLWAVVTTDTGVAVYNAAGKLMEKYPEAWGAAVEFSATGMLAIATIDRSVVVRRPGRSGLVKLADTEDIIRRNTNGLTVRWSGARLFVRSVGSLRCWDLDGVEPEHTGGELLFEGDDLPTTMAAGERWAAVGLLHGGIVLVDAASMKEADRLSGHAGAVTDLRFAGPDLLGSVAEDGTLRYWALQPTWRFGEERAWLVEGAEPWAKIESADYSAAAPAAAPGRPYGTRIAVTAPDGKRVATTGDDGKVRVWDPHGNVLLLTLQGMGMQGEALAFSKDGAQIGGAFFTPGQDWSAEQIWAAQPWTREAAGIPADADWRAGYEARRARIFAELWQQNPEGR